MKGIFSCIVGGMRRRPFPLRHVTVLALLLLPGMQAGAGEMLAGPIIAEPLRVIDGDTVSVRVRVWLDLDMTVDIRIRGIDTPERRGACAEEKALARMATEHLAALALPGPLRLTRIEHDKYAGRIVADVVTGDGTDIAALMRSSGLARAYDGKARPGWCGLAALE